jgi:hypothetical protein
MTPDEIHNSVNAAVAQALQDHLPAAVQTAVDKAVNGKIKALDAKVTPMVEAYDKWISLRRFAIVVVGFFFAIGGAIQSAEAVWSVVTHYFTVGIK